MDWTAPPSGLLSGELSERVRPVSIGYESLTDEELVHCFDRELEAGDNPIFRGQAQPISDPGPIIG